MGPGDEDYPIGTVPLGENPGLGPIGPLANLQAAHSVSIAFNHGTVRQRRASAFFLVVFALPALVLLVALIVSAIR